MDSRGNNNNNNPQGTTEETSKDFSYVLDIAKIDPDLICPICHLPAVNPLCSPDSCAHLFCLYVIMDRFEDNFNNNTRIFHRNCVSGAGNMPSLCPSVRRHNSLIYYSSLRHLF